MPFIPVPNTAEIVLHFTQDLQQLANVFNVKLDHVPSSADLGDIAAAFQTWWTTVINVQVPSSIRLVSITARDLTTEGGAGIEVPVNTVGGSSDPPLPNNCTVAVKWTTGLSGRSFRGRTYHVGLSRGMVVNDTVQPTPLPDLQHNYDTLRTAIGDLGFNMAVVSRFHDRAPRVTGISTPIIACTVEPTVDSQRRRLPGRGN